MGKSLKYLVIHCTATRASHYVTKIDIERWHRGPLVSAQGITYKGKRYRSLAALPQERIGGVLVRNLRGRGWIALGYSDLITTDGAIINITPYDMDDEVDSWEITNGASGINSISRHIVYAGGVDVDGVKPLDTRTCTQRSMMEQHVKFFLEHHPDILIAGHNQFANKACPSFWVPDWLREIGIPEKNIYNADPFKVAKTFKKQDPCSLEDSTSK